MFYIRRLAVTDLRFGQFTGLRRQRCDAGKPACDKCLAMGRGSRCEYQDTKYLTAIASLEEQVRTLQARLTELEVPGGLAAGSMNLVCVDVPINPARKFCS